jgi:Ca-activated chloride channel family protein
MSLRIATIVLLFIAPSFAVADDYRNKANAGYDSYKNGEYDKAEENYRQAGIVAPEKPLPNLGKGAAEYRMKNFEGAGREFSLAADKGTGKTKADALYNIGNSLYRAGNYQEALKSYVEALKIDPFDKDYKHNLELALLKQQQKQQQQQQKQDNKDENKKQQDQQKSDKSNQEKEKKDQQADQSQQQSQQDKKDQEENARKQSADQQRMSEEEARNLLARFEQDDKEVQEKLRRFNIGRSGGRDW